MRNKVLGETTGQPKSKWGNVFGYILITGEIILSGAVLEHVTHIPTMLLNGVGEILLKGLSMAR